MLSSLIFLASNTILIIEPELFRQANSHFEQTDELTCKTIHIKIAFHVQNESAKSIGYNRPNISKIDRRLEVYRETPIEKVFIGTFAFVTPIHLFAIQLENFTLLNDLLV